MLHFGPSRKLRMEGEQLADLALERRKIGERLEVAAKDSRVARNLRELQVVRLGVDITWIGDRGVVKPPKRLKERLPALRIVLSRERQRVPVFACVRPPVRDLEERVAHATQKLNDDQGPGPITHYFEMACRCR
eukprot:Amastigsp_a510809_58.p4 type:complete len:134 gc:universal Amastigsp_a510809_58:696-295(-)